MSKVLALLLAFISMAANAPGWNLAGRPSAAAAGSNQDATADAAEPGAVAGSYIDEWLDQMDEAMTAWSQLDVSTLDLSLGASDHMRDPSRTLLASVALETPEHIARLAALDPLVSTYFAGTSGRGRVRSAFDSLAGSGHRSPGGSGTIGGIGGGGGGSGGTGGGGGSSTGEGGQDSKNDNPPAGTDPGPGPDSGPDPGPGPGPGPGSNSGPGPGSNSGPGPGPGSDPGPIGEPGTTPPVSVPEPASMGLLGLGLIGMSLVRRRRVETRRA